MTEAEYGERKWWAMERVGRLYKTPEGQIVTETTVIEQGELELYGYVIERRKIPGFGKWKMDESTIMPVDRKVRAYRLCDGTFMNELEMPDGFFDGMPPVASATAVFKPETWSYEIDMESVEIGNNP